MYHWKIMEERDKAERDCRGGGLSGCTPQTYKAVLAQLQDSRKSPGSSIETLMVEYG